MKKMKPNLRKIFNFHTIILVVLWIVLVVTLQTVEGKLQRSHNKHGHRHNYQQHNNNNDDSVGGGFVENTDDYKVTDKHQLQHHNHEHAHHHNHHHNQEHTATTPSLEFTTSSSDLPSSTPSPSSLSGDNEFLIKEQQDLPLLTNKDEIYYKTKDLKTSSLSTSTSKPSLSIHLMKTQNVHDHKIPATSSNSNTMKSSETKSNSRQEEEVHTHHNNYNSNRLISTPTKSSTKHQGLRGNADNIDVVIDIQNHSTDNFVATKSSERHYENSKLNLATKDKRSSNDHKPNHHYHHRDHDHDHSSSHNDQRSEQPEQKPDIDHIKHSVRQNYEDYYSDSEGDDDEEDDDYNEDIDGISYDDDNNLSDRSYARITRSKLDDDYIDDEPYRNGLNDLSMQRDAPGVLTEQKYMDVGNEKAVQQARERYIQEQNKRPRTPHELAIEHFHRMIQATKCRKPMPRVIPVSNNTSKRYEPYATILHRCGDDTGCCGTTASVCTVKRHEIVMVYVFSYDFNYRKEIEALPMQNHTECHCVNRGSLLHDSMPRDKRSGGSGGLPTNSYLQHFQRQQRRQHQLSQLQQQQLQQQTSHLDLQLQNHHHDQQLQNMLDCHCPRHFNVFEEDVERHAHLPKPHSVFIRKCRCDCLVNNQTCLRFKQGEEGFSLEDRKCILDRNCKPPVCSYGEYNLRIGRCPSYRSHLIQTT